MNLLLDMNIPPLLCLLLNKGGHNAKFWGELGAIQAGDDVISLWAKEHNYVIITQDLDFSAILAATGGNSPSVIQVRLETVNEVVLAPLLLEVIRKNADELDAGAIIALDETKSRVRILPIFRRTET